jgi:hypothetical protein
MLRLASLIYSIAATALAGAGVVVALSLNRYDLPAILLGAGAGALAALPLAWWVARRLQQAA